MSARQVLGRQIIPNTEDRDVRRANRVFGVPVIRFTLHVHLFSFDRTRSRVRMVPSPDRVACMGHGLLPRLTSECSAWHSLVRSGRSQLPGPRPRRPRVAASGRVFHGKSLSRT